MDLEALLNVTNANVFIIHAAGSWRDTCGGRAPLPYLQQVSKQPVWLGAGENLGGSYRRRSLSQRCAQLVDDKHNAGESEQVVQVSELKLDESCCQLHSACDADEPRTGERLWPQTENSDLLKDRTAVIRQTDVLMGVTCCRWIRSRWSICLTNTQWPMLTEVSV